MTIVLSLLSTVLTWLFFAGLIGACVVIVLFLADLFRTISKDEPAPSDSQPISG